MEHVFSGPLNSVQIIVSDDLPEGKVWQQGPTSFVVARDVYNDLVALEGVSFSVAIAALGAMVAVTSPDDPES